MCYVYIYIFSVAIVFLSCKFQYHCGSTWRHMISAQVKLKAALAGETSLSSCCLIWVLLWRDPEGSATVTRACRGQTARSHFVNPCHVPVRFLIHKNGKEGELTPVYLPFALPCCCLNSYRKMDILLTPNDRGWREDEGNGRLCRLMFGVRPSSLEQTSNTLEECFRQNGLLVSERNSQTLIEKKKGWVWSPSMI